MKKYYFRIGLCALLFFANSCQKSDNQENKEVQNISSEKEKIASQAQKDSQKVETRPFITSGGDLFMPLDRQGTVASPKAEKFQKVKTAAVFETLEQSKTETFLVKNEDPQQIELKEGTKIYIPDNAFVLAETGELVRGEVKIEAKEVRNVAECLKRGVTTMSNAGLLESGGMLYIGATYEGKKCELKQGKELDVEMPTWGEKKEGMKLFAGEKNADGKIEWKEMPDNQVATEQKETPWTQYNCNTYQQRIDSIEEYILRNQNVLSNLDFKFRNIQVKVLPNNGITKEDANLAAPKQYFQFTGKPIPRLTKVANEYKVVKDTLHLYVNISKVSRNGKMEKWEIKENSNIKYSNAANYNNFFHSQLISILKKRKWNKTGTVELALYLPKKYIPKLREMYPNCKDVAAFRKKYQPQYAEYFQRLSAENAEAAQRNNPEVCEKYQKLMLKAAAERKQAQEVSNYYFRTKRLGWINCDRFTNMPKTKMALQLGDFEDVMVTVVYKKINSLMSYNFQPTASNKVLLEGIPQNYNIDLFVVKRMNGKLYCCLRSTNTDNRLEEKFDFEEVTEERLAIISKKMGSAA